MGTFHNAFGTTEPTEEQIEFCSLDRGLSKETTVPAFLWHTADDVCVNVQNSLRMATALSEAGVPFEAHIYPHGSHGLGLANEITALNERMILPRIAGWVDLAFSWMKTI
jgi:dipeptidyl aminopeptidase/acylaminoacyl peptidase